MIDNNKVINSIVRDLVDTESFTIEPIGGMTNKNYLVITDKEKLVVRIPGSGVGSLIDREAEIHTNNELNSHPVLKEIVVPTMKLTDEGYKVSRYDDYTHLDIYDDRQIRLAISHLKSLHNSKIKLKSTKNPFSLFYFYESLIEDKSLLEPMYSILPREVIDRLHDNYTNLDVEYLPCHLDTVPENFMFLGDNLYLNDFEYASMSDPLWDIVNIYTESNISDINKYLELAKLYYSEVDSNMKFRLLVCSLMTTATWCIWSILSDQLSGNSENKDYYQLKLNQLKEKVEASNVLDNAIILASGLGSRLRPYTDKVPKPLLPINGLPIIEHTINHLQSAGITDITIVVGYLSESFDYLKSKYKGITLIQNNHYNDKNNAYSISLALDKLQGTYVVDGDVYIVDNIFEHQNDKSYYFVQSRIDNSKEWLLATNSNGKVIDYEVLETNNSLPVHASMSYWHKDDCSDLRELLSSLNPRYFDITSYVWDHFVIKSNKVNVFTREILESSSIEVDTVDEYLNLCKGVELPCLN